MINLRRPDGVTAFTAGLLCGAAITAAIGFAAPTNADEGIDGAAVAAATVYGTIICDALTDRPHPDTLYAIGTALMQEGFTGRQAGQTTAIAVVRICPQHAPVINAFIASHGSRVA